MTGEIEPIPPEQAREILEAAIRERLGEGWDDDDTGWVRVSGGDYMARLARGRVTLDFYVDLLGQVTVEKSDQDAAWEGARLALVILLALSVVIALLLVRIVSGG